MTSPKAAVILFQALTGLKIIEFLSNKLVTNERWENNLSLEESGVL